MGEAIVAIIAALGGTAGLVSIINAFKQPKRSDQEVQDLVLKAIEKSDLNQKFKDINDRLDSHLESQLSILRHEITEIYYKYLENKEIPAHTKESVLMMYEQYEKLGGNSYVHTIVEEIKSWETIN